MISLLVPTRNRPDNIKRLWGSVKDTADNLDDIELITYIDNDDSSYDSVKVPMTRVRGDRIVLSEMWNKCYEASKGNILMHCGDDIVFRTKGWDTKVKDKLDEFSDRIVFVFGNDGSGTHDGNFGTHGFIHRRWVETVGYFVPPYFSSDYNDTWLNDVARIIGRHVHIDILTEHMHPDFDKAEFDITHQERVERHKRDNVAQLYESLHEERHDNANKLREVME